MILEYLRGTSTPLKSDVWCRELLQHPDREFVEIILHGITEGFRIGYDASKSQLKQQATNMLSASAHREVVSHYISYTAGMCGLGGNGPQHGNPLQSIGSDPEEKQAKQVAPNHQPLHTRRL